MSLLDRLLAREPKRRQAPPSDALERRWREEDERREERLRSAERRLRDFAGVLHEPVERREGQG